MSYYFDFNTRNNIWQSVAKLRQLPPTGNGSAQEPTLILIHTTDLKKEFHKMEPRWSDPASMVKDLRTQFGPMTAFLYFSGGGSPWEVFKTEDGHDEYLRPASEDKYQYIYEPRIGKDREIPFADRLKCCIEDFAARGSPPRWEMLNYNWKMDAADFLCAALIQARIGKAALDAFLRTSLADGPFGLRTWTYEKPTLVGEMEARLNPLYDLLSTPNPLASASLPSLVNAMHKGLCDVNSLPNSEDAAKFVVCHRKLQEIKSRLSHDLYGNAFGGLLQPGFQEGLSEKDVVLRAIRGDAECREQALEPALAIWRQVVAPALEQLIGDVTHRYGFIPSNEWCTAVKPVSEAAARLATFTFEDAGASQTALSRAKAFWTDCEIINAFLSSFNKSFSRYFIRWDPAQISEAYRD